MLAVLAFVGWLIARPPRDERDAAVRLAVGYAVMFTLDPSTRFGYFAYPLALVGWLALSRQEQREKDRRRTRRPAPLGKLLPGARPHRSRRVADGGRRRAAMPRRRTWTCLVQDLAD